LRIREKGKNERYIKKGKERERRGGDKNVDMYIKKGR
jgi:hypothetical protein